ncbi:MAG: acetate--CoA ligase [Flavobacteriales bacterium]|jgi:acetyl-CoA synthetase|nr:MAG: acetate--CoA ligase [Flavobacteriales bacterium]
MQEQAHLNGLPEGALNIAHEAVDRHADGSLRDAIALRCIRRDDRITELSYGELRARSDRFAHVIKALGLQGGERVFNLTGRIPELYVSAIGTLKAGAVFCPLFSVFGPEPIYQRLSRGDARVLVTTTELYKKKVAQLIDRLPALEHVLLNDAAQDLDHRVRSLPMLMAAAPGTFAIVHTRPEDPALLHFTSGTTGMPKGALHVHRAVVMHAMTGCAVLDLHPGDIYWCTADPGWVTGTSYGIIAPLVLGACIVVDEEEFDAARWYHILAEQRVNVWYTAPTAIRRLMRLDIDVRGTHDLSALRLMLSVGEPLHAEAVVWAQRTFGVPVLDNWWQTETGGIMISNTKDMPVKPGSMGKPLPGITAEVADVDGDGVRILQGPERSGHLVLKRGWPSQFVTYLHEEERYAKCFRGDWYLSGDLARIDADGYFWFVGRADDIIKTSGHMVGPFEVESRLMEHPAVAEAAVIGKPDPLIGELVKACVVLKSGQAAGEKLRMDIIGFARKALGPAVAPKELAFVDDLPKTRSGKVLRRLLKARELGLPEGDLSTLEKT